MDIAIQCSICVSGRRINLFTNDHDVHIMQTAEGGSRVLGFELECECRCRFDAAVFKIRRKESVTDAIDKGKNALSSQSQTTSPMPSPRAIRTVAGIAGWLIQQE